mmetsp:Transcript_50656/g.68925  ORF Transcript_50656/g.68925 Transcript_50656/m.68925 type:complete len:483 (-) Transcript_50656:107-1555(-)|eukprot:CAMPEP_0185770686 /NCGR_PEP_ID=MMETSP1174-20130828/60533_1 /TAXON_ID=35687 /ORGANISM="Dictyocha speculum, Strain CCMP1381" /LENGTH=482 /DNA_ID=CAMNT_0028456231 /DNA_START=40 /DNA_END=1488 /DNA_ORIENTATION=+
MPRKGGARKKRRTHVVDQVDPSVPDGKEGAQIPKSMIIRAPRTTLPNSLKQLQNELRSMMAPNTAENLREKKYNTLKDYTHVAGLLSVTHIMLISPGGTKVKGGASGTKSDASVPGTPVEGAGALLRIARVPQGPTLTLRIEQYTLSRQIRAIQKSTYTSSTLFKTPPLVVLNNFGGNDGAPIPPHLKLMRITFQNMFPPLDVATMKLSECRRVVLFNLCRDSEKVEMRHYAIKAKPVCLSRPIKQIMERKGRLPDLGHMRHIEDWLLGSEAGLISAAASDSEAEDETAAVMLETRTKRGAASASSAETPQTSAAIKLYEVGPRITFSLLKVEREVCAGDIMYHALETRTPEQVAAQRAERAKAAELKKQRREEQESNVVRKQEEKEAKKAKKRPRLWGKLDEDGEEGEDEEDDEIDQDDDEEGEEDDDAAAGDAGSESEGEGDDAEMEEEEEEEGSETDPRDEVGEETDEPESDDGDELSE